MQEENKEAQEVQEPVLSSPANPVVTSQQTVTEPARSGAPNPVRTSEQDVTEPALQPQEAQPTENDDKDDIDPNVEPSDVDEPTPAHPDETPSEE